MHDEVLAPNDWVRAATLAQMLLSQSLSDEQLDEIIGWALIEPAPVSDAA